MYSKNIAVKCPYCGAEFSIPVGARYKSAEAIAIACRCL
jgi:ribosomal protein S27E